MEQFAYEYNWANQLINLKGFNHATSDSLFAHYSYDAKGNNIRINQFVKDGISLDTAYQLFFYIEYAYDDKKNPHYPITGLPYYTPAKVLSPNNVISYSHTIWGSRVINADTVVTSSKYTYEYNEKDLPIKQMEAFSQQSKTINNTGESVGVYQYNPCK